LTDASPAGAAPSSGEPSPLEAIIRRRRMTRTFDPAPLPDATVVELLDLARRAPSAGYSQGVHFLALSGAAVRRFWQVTGGDDWFDDGVTAAPVIVLPLADPDAYTSRYAEGDKAGHGLELAANWEVPFWLTDAAMAAQNLLLLAEERGLGALYFGIFRNAQLALQEFGVPPHVLQVGAVALGHRAATDVPSGSAVTRPRRPRIDVVHHQHW
jgi:nitroreductase